MTLWETVAITMIVLAAMATMMFIVNRCRLVKTVVPVGHGRTVVTDIPKNIPEAHTPVVNMQVGDYGKCYKPVGDGLYEIYDAQCVYRQPQYIKNRRTLTC